MVERPIKKSDRQAEPALENNTDESVVESNTERPSSRPVPKSKSERSERDSERSSGGKDKGRGGKKGSFDDEPKAAFNPALARGPKPVKAPVIVEQPIEAVDENGDDNSEESTES